MTVDEWVRQQIETAPELTAEQLEVIRRALT